MGLPGSTLGVGCTLCTPLYGGPKGQGPTRPVEVPRRGTVRWVGGPLAAYHGPARLPHSTWSIKGHAPPVTSGQTSRTGPNRAAKCPKVRCMIICWFWPPQKDSGKGLASLYPPLWRPDTAQPNSACGRPKSRHGGMCVYRDIFRWFHIVSAGFRWFHIPRYIQMVSYGFIYLDIFRWFHMVADGFRWFHMFRYTVWGAKVSASKAVPNIVSCLFICIRLGSAETTWFRMFWYTVWEPR